MRIFNFSLTVAAAVIAILVFTNIVLARSNAISSSKLAQVQQILNSTPNNRNALRALATRVNQAATQDNDLRAVLQKLEISITPDASVAH